MKNKAAQSLRAIKSEKRSEASRENGKLGGYPFKPCEKCQENRWKTKVKGKEYECRNCGEVRVKE